MNKSDAERSDTSPTRINAEDYGPLSHLAREGSNDDIGECLSRFDSYARAEALAVLMMFVRLASAFSADISRRGNVCDAPWPYRAMIADKLRPSVAEVNLVELLEPVARDFYVSLPDPVPVWRGCEQARERGLYWTAERAVAEGFARGRRCVNKHPTLVSAEIPKRHIFGVFVHRKEHEVVLDYRRLRKLRVAQIVAEPY